MSQENQNGLSVTFKVPFLKKGDKMSSNHCKSMLAELENSFQYQELGRNLTQIISVQPW